MGYINETSFVDDHSTTQPTYKSITQTEIIDTYIGESSYFSQNNVVALYQRGKLRILI